jgi:hypothetical protein
VPDSSLALCQAKAPCERMCLWHRLRNPVCADKFPVGYPEVKCLGPILLSIIMVSSSDVLVGGGGDLQGAWTWRSTLVFKKVLPRAWICTASRTKVLVHGEAPSFSKRWSRGHGYVQPRAPSGLSHSLTICRRCSPSSSWRGGSSPGRVRPLKNSRVIHCNGHVRMYARRRVCEDTHMHTRTHIHTHTRMYARPHTRTHTH